MLSAAFRSGGQLCASAPSEPNTLGACQRHPIAKGAETAPSQWRGIEAAAEQGSHILAPGYTLRRVLSATAGGGPGMLAADCNDRTGPFQIDLHKATRSDTPPEDCPKHHLSTQHRPSGSSLSDEPCMVIQHHATQYYASDDMSTYLEGTVHGGVPCRSRSPRATPISFTSPRFSTPGDTEPPCNSPRTIISFPRLPAAAQPDASALPQPGYDASWQSLDADAGSDVAADANSMPPHQLLARTASLAAAMPGSSGPHCSPRSFHEEFVGPSSLRARPAAQLRLRDGVLRATNPAFL